MAFSKNQDEQNILLAIRECLLQDDPRMAQLEGRPHNDSALEKDDKSVEEVSYHAAAGIVPESTIKPIGLQTTAQGGAVTHDGPSTAHNELASGQNARPASLLGPSDSPSIAPDAPAIDTNSRRTSSQKVSSPRPSVAKRLFRTGTYGVVVTVIVSTAFVWQFGDDATKGIVKGWANSLDWSSPRPATNLLPKADSAAEAVSTSAGQPPQTKTTAILPAASASEPTPTSTTIDSPPESSPDLKKKLETITSDLALVRQLVEQVAARQDQMARDIATLQADEWTVRHPSRPRRFR
jgi:hypothetical protein